MKLVMAIIHDEDAFEIIDLLNESGYGVTKLASTGGFLRSGNTTIICGVEDEKTEELMNIIEKTCRSRKRSVAVNSTPVGPTENYVPLPIDVTVGGATVFVLDVCDFKKF